jgi:hypothetical protein
MEDFNMLTIQSDLKTPSIEIYMDTSGIDEFIEYLNFIKNRDISYHLNSGNELDEEPFNEKIFVVHHLKLINVDRLEKSNQGT